MSVASGEYRPVCATTSINRFQVRVCPISASARATVSLVSSEVARSAQPLGPKAAFASRPAIARVKSVCCTDPYVGLPARTLCVSATIAFAALIAQDAETTGVGDGLGVGPRSFSYVRDRIAASTGAFLV